MIKRHKAKQAQRARVYAIPALNLDDRLLMTLLEDTSAHERRRRRLHFVSNLLLLIGLFVLLLVGGIEADARYNVYAARGDTAISAPTPRIATPVPTGAPAQTAAAAPTPTTAFEIPVLNGGSDSPLTNAVPSQSTNAGPSTISRIVIPAINLDRKVVEVGWTPQQEQGQTVAVYEVDTYRVGHHQGTSNPGGGDNIVLAGHSGGRDYPFNDLFYLKPGDLIELTSNGQQYNYTVSEHIVVDEVGQPLEKRLENARYINPTDQEVVTMVACWPLTGPNKFNQRVIIRATPAFPTISADEANRDHSGWTAR